MSKHLSQQNEAVASDSDGENAGRKHDLFRDPALGASWQDDPVATFLLANWKVILASLLALFGFFYFKSQIEVTANSRVAESSETFDKARKAVVSLLDTKERKLSQDGDNAEKSADNQAENEKLMRSAIDSLNALKSGPDPYAVLAPIYENLLQQSGLKASDLGKIDWERNVSSGERLALELQEFVLIKKLLDSNDGFREAVSRLSKLAEKGSYLRAPAALTLLRVVEDPQDKAKAIFIGQDVAKSYPEQAARIETELKRLS